MAQQEPSKWKYSARSKVIMVIFSIIPLLLSCIPADLLYVPIAGTVIAPIVVLYALPALVIGSLTNTNLVIAGNGMTSIYHWKPIGILITLLFWIPVLEILGYVWSKNQSLLSKAEKDASFKRRHRHDAAFLFIILFLVLAIAIFYTLLQFGI